MCAVFANNHVDVNLVFTLKAVEIVTALGCLKIYIDSCGSISSSCHIEAVHAACKVVNLAVVKFALSHTELVCSACYGSINYTKGRSLGIGINGILVAALTGSVGGDPTVLHLRIVVLTDDTVNSDGIACNGLNCHILVGGSAGSVVSTVDAKSVSTVGYVHITVLVVVNFLDNAGNVVLALGVLILNLGVTKRDSLCDSESGIGSGIRRNRLLVGSKSLSIAGEHKSNGELTA